MDEHSENTDKKIESIKDPVLILHNLDDNNVSVRVSKHWYDKAVRIGKGKLVRFYTTKVGNMIPNDFHNKGHFLPNDVEAFQAYADTIVHFILNGPSGIKALSEWRSLEAGHKASEGPAGAIVQEKFLALAQKQFKEADAVKGPAARVIDEQVQSQIWLEHYMPLLYAIDFAEHLKHDDNALNTETTYLSNLHGTAFDLNSAAENALKLQLPRFFQFLKETGNGQSQRGEVMAKDKHIQAKFLGFIKSGSDELRDPDVRALLFSSFYLGNPSLLDNGLMSQAAYNREVSKWSGVVEQLRGDFLQQLARKKELIRKTFQDSAKAVIPRKQ